MRAFASAKYLMLFPLKKDRRCKHKEVVRTSVLFAQEMSTAARELIQDISMSIITKNLTAREGHSELLPLGALCD